MDEKLYEDLMSFIEKGREVAVEKESLLDESDFHPQDCNYFAEVVAWRGAFPGHRYHLPSNIITEKLSGAK